MLEKPYLHQMDNFGQLVSVVANELSIDPYLVEKDYWIMHCLYGLEKAGNQFHLKGGTSLSKAYRIIDRFSEDIDLFILPPSELKYGKNHNKQFHIDGRKKFFDNLVDGIRIDGVQISRDYDFDDPSGKYRNGGLRLHYGSALQNVTAGVKEGVLLEVGFANTVPNKPVDISSWVFDAAHSRRVEAIDNRARGVMCYDPGYTFVEKLQTIATKFRLLEKQGSLMPNFIRHYYDVYCLLGQKEVLAFIGTDSYVDYKKKHFPNKDLELPITQNQAFLLDEPEMFELFEKEYLNKSALYYRGQPSFSEIIKRIKDNIANL